MCRLSGTSSQFGLVRAFDLKGLQDETGIVTHRTIFLITKSKFHSVNEAMRRWTLQIKIYDDLNSQHRFLSVLGLTITSR